jgi:hypothetical protein
MAGRGLATIAVNKQAALAVDSEPLREGLGRILPRLLGAEDGHYVVSDLDTEYEAVACIGWSAISDLATKPELAWLIAADVPYLRLPVTLSDLRSFIHVAAASADERQPRRDLTMPLGQFVWALDAASEVVRRSDTGTERRVRELQCFASKHWPGVFDFALQRVKSDLSAREWSKGAGILHGVARIAASATLHNGLRFLSDGEVGTALADGISLLQQASVASSALDQTDLADIVGKDWWSPARDRLDAVVAEIRDVTDAGISLPSELLDYVRRLSEALNGLATICSRLAKASGKGTGNLQRIVDWTRAGSLCREVSDAIAWLRSDAERVRRELGDVTPSRG